MGVDVRAVTFVFAISAVSAWIAYAVVRGFGLALPLDFDPVYQDLPYGDRLAFTQVAAMHETSYGAAAISTLGAAAWVFWRRGRQEVRS